MIRLLLALLMAFMPSVATAAVGNISAPSAASSLVLRTGASSLYGVNVVSGAAAGYIMVFDAAAVPADGAVTPSLCLPLAANTGVDWNFRAEPVRFMVGSVVVFSTTGCFTKTSSATAFISGSAQ